MASTKELVIELFEMSNSVKYLSRQFGVDSRAPMLASAFTNCFRVLTALQERSAAYFKSNSDLEMLTLTYNVSLQQISEILSIGIETMNTEGSDTVVSAVKNKLCKEIENVADKFTIAAGYLSTKVANEGIRSSFDSDVLEFLDSAYPVFIKASEEDEVLDRLLDDASFENDADEARAFLREQEREDDISALLAAQGSHNPNHTNKASGPIKAVITPDIEKD